MAKPIIVSLSGKESSFALAKVERSKLYPTRKRVPLDGNGVPCSRAAMMSDGNIVLRSGMTAQGYFTAAGRWVAKEELVGINPDGSVAELKPSTLGVAQVLEGPVPARDLLDLKVDGVYVLEPESVDAALLASLQQGNLYRFPFNYGTDYNCETAYLVANEDGVFAVVGNPVVPAWVEEATVYVAEPEEETAGDLDFEMM
jgi:hypothetical protein